MQYKFHLQENLSFKNLRGYLIINELKKPLKERSFQGRKKVSVVSKDLMYQTLLDGYIVCFIS